MALTTLQSPSELSPREQELLSGNCPPERPCTARQIEEYLAHYKKRPAKNCIHLGPATGQQQFCESCQGKNWIKIFACAIHGKCTPQTALEGIACCQTCPDYATSPVPPG